MEDINHYPVATIQTLEHLIHRRKMEGLLVVLTMDERRVVDHELPTAAWERFRQTLGEDLLTLNLNASDGIIPWQQKAKAPQAQDILLLENFLCLDDCLRLDDLLGLRPPEVDSFEDEELSFALAGVYYLKGDYPTAVLLYRNLLKWERGRGDVAPIILIYRRLGYLSFLRNNLPEARKWAHQALRLAQNSQVEEELFYALFLIFILDSREPFMTLEEWEGHLKELVRLGESLQKPNNLAYRLSKPDRYNPVDHAQAIETMIDQAIRIAEGLGNELRLANAYHILGYSKLFRGDDHAVMPLYRKSEKLRKRIGNFLELSYLYNGIGYFLHQQGDFQKSFPYLQKSVQFAFRAGDYHEICMGLCNIAINDLYSFQPEQAAFSLEKVIRIMNILEIKNLSFHSFREVLLLYGVAMFLSGHPDRAYEKYSMIQAMELPPTDRSKTSTEQDEILIENLFQALMADHEGQGKQSLGLLESALQELQNHEDIIAYRIPFVAVLLGDGYQKGDQSDRAQEIWTLGLSLAQSRRYHFYEKVLQARLNRQKDKVAPLRKSWVLDFDRILENARSTMDLQKLHKVVERIDILNTFRQALDHQDDESQLVSRALGLINTAFPSDVLVYSYFREGQWVSFQETFSSQVKWRMAPEAKAFPDRFWSQYPGLSQIRRNPEQSAKELPFQLILHIPLSMDRQKYGHLFLGSVQGADYGLSDDLKLLEIATFQLTSVLEKRWKDQKLTEATRALEKLAVTDPLTGLSNRNALLDRLNEEKERFLRYSRKIGYTFSIIFIDLDNFKIYNDTFGHKLGDQFLEQFSQLVRNHLRTVDFACRYGGDEFILILPETQAPGAEIVAKRILDTVKDGKPFDVLLRQEGLDPDLIPENTRLGCSFGIAEFQGESTADVSVLMQEADKALYEAKKRGKNQIVLVGT